MSFSGIRLNCMVNQTIILCKPLVPTEEYVTYSHLYLCWAKKGVTSFPVTLIVVLFRGPSSGFLGVEVLSQFLRFSDILEWL